MPNITENPDYRLVMTFLQNIRPGDMDQESSEQLMMIGQRIQAGGALSDREREMFEAVVGATDRFPVEQMDSFPQGGTNPDLMKQPTMGAMSEGEMKLAMDTAMPTNLTPQQMDQFMAQKNAAQDKMQRSYQVDGGMERMSPQMMDSMVSSGDITQEGMSMDPNSAVRAGEMPMYDQRMPMDPNSAVRPSEMPSQDGKTYSQSSGVTPANNVMTLEEAVAAGIVAPTARPQARPAPMRPQARPTR